MASRPREDGKPACIGVTVLKEEAKAACIVDQRSQLICYWLLE